MSLCSVVTRYMSNHFYQYARYFVVFNSRNSNLNFLDEDVISFAVIEYYKLFDSRFCLFFLFLNRA